MACVKSNAMTLGHAGPSPSSITGSAASAQSALRLSKAMAAVWEFQDMPARLARHSDDFAIADIQYQTCRPSPRFIWPSECTAGTEVDSTLALYITACVHSH